MYLKSTQGKKLITNVTYNSLHGYNNKVGKDELVTEEKPLFAIFNYESKSKFGAERLMYPISAGFPFRFVSSKWTHFLYKIKTRKYDVISLPT